MLKKFFLKKSASKNKIKIASKTSQIPKNKAKSKSVLFNSLKYIILCILFSKVSFKKKN